MRGTIGMLLGVIVIALGLGGLSCALAQMMTHADPNANLIAIGGLAVFLAACLVALVAAR